VCPGGAIPPAKIRTISILESLFVLVRR